MHDSIQIKHQSNVSFKEALAPSHTFTSLILTSGAG